MKYIKRRGQCKIRERYTRANGQNRGMSRMGVGRLLACMALAAVGFGGTAAAAVLQYQAKTVNWLRTGNVKIALEEFMRQENGEEAEFFWEEPVLPGQRLSKIPRITDLSANCYVRVALEWGGEAELDEACFMGISDQWVKRGKYWYFKPILEETESTDFFSSIWFPQDWSEEEAESAVFVSIRAEAIQAAGFEPDYSSEDPWFGEEAEYCLQEFGIRGEGDVYMPMYVRFQDSLTVEPGDFFENMPILMPGQEYGDAFVVENKAAEEAEIFFRTEIPKLTEDQRQLLDQMELTIRGRNGELLYEGDLAAEMLGTGISLGIYQPEEQDTVNFSISMPPELKNAYAFRDSSVVWIFETQRMTPEPSQPTGDKNSIRIALFSISGTCSLLILAGIIGKQRRKVKNVI